MRIALIGTRGVPPEYGGFETAVDEVGSRLVEAGHDVTVYCRNPGQTLETYRGMTLVNLPALRRRSFETLSHTALSAVHAIRTGHPDVAFVFNAANAPFVPLLRRARIPVALHLDGIESAREKWRGAGAAYFRWAERRGARWADAVIADARAIAGYISRELGGESEFIPYGAPIVSPGSDRLAELGLTAGGYHLVVARFEPENNIDVAVGGFVRSASTSKLVVVGGAPYSDEYTQRVRGCAGDDPRVEFLGPVWDQDLLDQLYANAASYLHGHSVGGTNPSLLRAMGAGAPVLAFDVVFNREVTGGFARFFEAEDDLARLVEEAEADPELTRDMGLKGREHVAREYDWDVVARDYEALALRLVGRRGERGSEA